MWVGGVKQTFDAVARGKKSIKPLDQVRMPTEQLQNPLNHPRSVDALTFEVLHNVQNVVIHVCLVIEQDLNLIQIAQGVFHI